MLRMGRIPVQRRFLTKTRINQPLFRAQFDFDIDSILAQSFVGPCSPLVLVAANNRPDTRESIVRVDD